LLGAPPEEPQSFALRSKIVLACAEGPTNREVAAGLGVAEATVGKWSTAQPVAYLSRGTGRVDGPAERQEPRPGSIPPGAD